MRASRGFTLLELLVVMTIIGILMATSFAAFVGVGRRAKFEGAARAIKDKVMLARTCAITKSRKFAVRATLTKHKKWKIILVDSVDNIFDNEDDRMVDKAYYLPKQITLDEEQELEFTPEGGISYSTVNPIVVTDSSDKREIWKISLTLYKAAGMARMGAIEKIDMRKLEEEEEAGAEGGEEESLEDQLGLGD